MAKTQEPGKFTVFTKLDPAHNALVIEAFEREVHEFNIAKILTFHQIRKLNMAGQTFDLTEKTHWNTYLQNEFHITKRTANSIITEADTLWKMNLAALETSVEQDLIKEKSLMREIEDLTKTRDRNTKILTGEKPLRKRKSETEEDYQNRVQKRFDKTAAEQRRIRSKLVSKKKHLDKLKVRIKKKKEILETKNLRICFGTKKLQAKDPEKFRAQRDSQMSFIGSKDECCQNQIFQLYWSRSRNQFDIRMRRDFYEKPVVIEEKTINHKAKNGKPAWQELKRIQKREPEEQKFVCGRVHFNYGASQIRWCLQNRTGPLSYRIIRKGTEYFLYCTFDWHAQASIKSFPSLNPEREEDQAVICAADRVFDKEPAAIGVDINKGFLAVSIMNKQGGLIDTFNLDYRFGQGTKSRNDLSFLISRLAWLSLMLNAPIVIEDINLSEKKHLTRKKDNRAINSMLHSFAYRLYKKSMEETCYRYGAKLIKVNPAWTSEIARQNYCIPMKLCVHNGAAWVIARRGMGYKDTCNKYKKKEDKNWTKYINRKTKAESADLNPAFLDEVLDIYCQDLPF